MELISEGLEQAWRLIVGFDADVWQPAWRSLWFSSVATAAAGLFGIPIAMVLARRSFVAKPLVLLLFRAGMALPTVFIGIVGYSLFSRRGPLGPWDLLYTSSGVVIGEFALALPIVVTLSYAALNALDSRVAETARTLGAFAVQRGLTYASEARAGIALAVLTAFSRCITELGIAMMVGGNLKGQTRTLSTATALETSKGELGRGFALGMILLLLALLVFALTSRIHDDQARRSTE